MRELKRNPVWKHWETGEIVHLFQTWDTARPSGWFAVLVDHGPPVDVLADELHQTKNKPKGLDAGGGGAWIWGLVGRCTGHDLTYTDLQNSCPSPSISNDLDDNHHQKTTPKSNRCMRDGGNQMQQNGEKQPKRIGSPQRESLEKSNTPVDERRGLERVVRGSCTHLHWSALPCQNLILNDLNEGSICSKIQKNEP